MQLEAIAAQLEEIKRRARLMVLEEFMIRPDDDYLADRLQVALANKCEQSAKHEMKQHGEKWFKRLARDKTRQPSKYDDVRYASQCPWLDTLTPREGIALANTPPQKIICDVGQHGDNAYNKNDEPLMMCMTKMAKPFDQKYDRRWTCAEKAALQGIVLARYELGAEGWSDDFLDDLIGNSFVGPLVLILRQLLKLAEARAIASEEADALVDEALDDGAAQLASNVNTALRAAVDSVLVPSPDVAEPHTDSQSMQDDLMACMADMGALLGL